MRQQLMYCYYNLYSLWAQNDLKWTHIEVGYLHAHCHLSTSKVCMTVLTFLL
jgi:hypothetical protein